MSGTTDRAVQRQRHELKFRQVEVVSVERLTPAILRVTVGGDSLEGFYSPGFDDHMKLFPLAEGQSMPEVEVTPEGMVWKGERPASRDYTPRAYDAEARHLTIDFIVGHDGPATQWAMSAKIGSPLGIGGPRGSMLVPTDFARHLLIGDETALPAIARRLEDLPEGVEAVVCLEVEDEDSQIDLKTKARLDLRWVYRNGAGRGQGAALTEAAVAAAAEIEVEDCYVWVATESAVARAMRPKLLAANRFNPKHMKVAGYWRLGDEGHHDLIKDDED